MAHMQEHLSTTPMMTITTTMLPKGGDPSEDCLLAAAVYLRSMKVGHLDMSNAASGAGVGATVVCAGPLVPDALAFSDPVGSRLDHAVDATVGVVMKEGTATIVGADVDDLFRGEVGVGLGVDSGVGCGVGSSAGNDIGCLVGRDERASVAWDEGSPVGSAVGDTGGCPGTRRRRRILFGGL